MFLQKVFLEIRVKTGIFLISTT